MREPIITVITEKKIRELVDALITPERADEEGEALCELINLIADESDDAKVNFADVARRHAFSKSEAYEETFRIFAGCDVMDEDEAALVQTVSTRVQ